MRRCQVILSLAGVAGTAAFMLGLGAWRTCDHAVPNPLLPLPLTEMDWRLSNQHGQEVTAANWRGRPAMVFFGFTYCPDVCPTTLLDIADWLEALGPDANRLTIALITVDPELDTPDVQADYLSNFDPRIVGLTGSMGEIARAAAVSEEVSCRLGSCRLASPNNKTQPLSLFQNITRDYPAGRDATCAVSAFAS